jgi:lipopolysaccharide export system protein LptC
MRVSENIRLATLPPVSAVLLKAMIMWANVEVNMRKIQTKRKNNAPRSWTASVGSALRYNPIG